MTQLENCTYEAFVANLKQELEHVCTILSHIDTPIIKCSHFVKDTNGTPCCLAATDGKSL